MLLWLLYFELWVQFLAGHLNFASLGLNSTSDDPSNLHLYLSSEVQAWQMRMPLTYSAVHSGNLKYYTLNRVFKIERFEKHFSFFFIPFALVAFTDFTSIYHPVRIRSNKKKGFLHFSEWPDHVFLKKQITMFSKKSLNVNTKWYFKHTTASFKTFKTLHEVFPAEVIYIREKVLGSKSL